MPAPVGEELIRMLAAVADLEIPDEDMGLVEAYLTNVLSDAASLRRLPLAEVEPIVTMDPRWL
jgi:hypothetical protein